MDATDAWTKPDHSEPRSEHCKIYVEPTVKRAIETFAAREGLTFSEAGRSLWLNSPELQYELSLFKIKAEESRLKEGK